MGRFILSMLLLDAGLRADVVLPLQPWDRRRSGTARRLGGAGAGPARPADDPRRDDRHRLRAHAGEFEGQSVSASPSRAFAHARWVVQRHAVFAAIYGFAAIGVWSTCGARAATGGRSNR